MAHPSKASWEPCSLCGQKNGPVAKGHVTPSRYDISPMSDFLTQEERALFLAAGKADACGTCRTRVRMRVHRARAAL